MRLFTILVFSLALLFGGQAPRVASINFYGLDHVKEDRVRKALGVEEGQTLPGSKSDLEERLEAVSGVVRANIEAVCCEAGGGVTLNIGIEERGARHFELRDPPEGNDTLPETVMENYNRFLGALAEASRDGEAAEDLSEGHSLMQNRDVRTLQEVFLGYADLYAADLKRVLHNSADEYQRAAAACILGYASKKATVIPDLQYALTDPDDAVRTNAIRALTAIAVLASRRPSLGLRVQPTWFIEMLNSLLWSDRRQAARALVTLTESRDAGTLATLGERAMPSLVGIARSKHLDDAFPGFLLVGRICGISDKEIEDAWVKGDRETVIERALKPPKKQAE